MVICTDPREAFAYVLNEEKDSPEPTIFRLRALTAAQERSVLAAIQKLAKSDYADAELHDLRQRTLAEQLDGWDNMPDRAGNATRAEKNDDGTVTEASLALLAASWRVELFTAILNRGRIPAKTSD